MKKMKTAHSTLESQFHDAKDEIVSLQATLSRLQMQRESKHFEFEQERSDLKGKFYIFIERK
jgi:hypothetical protein